VCHLTCETNQEGIGSHTTKEVSHDTETLFSSQCSIRLSSCWGCVSACWGRKPNYGTPRDQGPHPCRNARPRKPVPCEKGSALRQRENPLRILSSKRDLSPLRVHHLMQTKPSCWIAVKGRPVVRKSLGPLRKGENRLTFCPPLHKKAPKILN